MWKVLALNILLSFAFSFDCTEKSDLLGNTCSQYVKDDGYDCVGLTNIHYDCHCTCTTQPPTPAPTVIPVQWDTKPGACLECWRTLSDYLSNVDECLSICLKSSTCNAATWFEPAIDIGGWATNCCPMQNCTRKEEVKNTNATVYFKELQDCYLTIDHDKLEAGTHNSPYWYNCDPKGTVALINNEYEIVDERPSNGSGIIEFFSVPANAKTWSDWAFVIFDANKNAQAFQNFTIVPQTCQFDCGYQSYPRTCECNDCGGYYGICCPDFDQYCSKENNNVTVYLKVSEVLQDADIQIEIEWWNGVKGSVLGLFDKDAKVTANHTSIYFENPGYGKKNFTVNLPAGNYSLRLNENGNTLAKHDLVATQSTQYLSSDQTFGKFQMFVIGTDNDLVQGGTRLLTISTNSYFQINDDKYYVQKLVSVVYDRSVDSIELHAASKTDSVDNVIILKGQMMFGGFYGDGSCFDFPWIYYGTITLPDGTDTDFALRSSI